MPMLPYVTTPSGEACKGFLQLEATFIDVKNMYLHLNPGWRIPFQCSNHQAIKTHDEEML